MHVFLMDSRGGQIFVFRVVRALRSHRKGKGCGTGIRSSDADVTKLAETINSLFFLVSAMPNGAETLDQADAGTVGQADVPVNSSYLVSLLAGPSRRRPSRPKAARERGRPAPQTRQQVLNAGLPRGRGAWWWRRGA